MERAKIFGERNTATNALRMLVESHSKTRILPSTVSEFAPSVARISRNLRSLGNMVDSRRLLLASEGLIDRAFSGQSALRSWKHTATNFTDASIFKGVPVIFCVRHPLSWLLSLFKNPYHNLGPRPIDLVAFAGTKWLTLGRENLGRISIEPLALLEIKYQSYRQFSKALSDLGIAYRVVHFEDMILDQGSVYADLKPLLSLPIQDFRELEQSTKTKSKNLDFYKDYYGQERWREETAALEDVLYDYMTPETLTHFGYS